MSGEEVLALGGVGLSLLMCFLLVRTILRQPYKEYEQQDAYFTPRMKVADQQLQALATRLGGEYVRGHVDWRSFATPADLASTEMKQPNSVWEGGSLMRKVIDGYEIEVTYGAQSLDTEQRGWGARAVWDVFVPRFTVIAARPRRPLNYFHAHWSSNEELQGATGRALDRTMDGALKGVLSLFGRTLLTMPPDVARAHQALTVKAAEIWCGKDRIEVTGRPLPRVRGDIREYGQGDFDVDSMATMIQRTLALVHAVENA